MTIHDLTKDKFNEGMNEFVGQNYGRAIDILTDVVAQDATHKLALTARGSAYLKLEDIESAIDDFTSAIEIDADYARAYHLRGLAFERQGNDEDALADFDMAVKANPEYGAAYYSRANLLIKLGRSDAATSDIEMVTHLTNKNIESLANESNIWRSQHLRLETMVENELNR